MIDLRENGETYRYREVLESVGAMMKMNER